eukprot:jgi/Tetstr1/454829/TSEL_041709.t1
MDDRSATLRSEDGVRATGRTVGHEFLLRRDSPRDEAYIADMEAARREAPADIERPELDGHHGIAVLNVPLGSPQYVQAYMRGKS